MGLYKMDKRSTYITARIEQLKEDKDKAHDPQDQMWYNRLIQELDWVDQIGTKGKRRSNCYMSRAATLHSESTDSPI